MREHAPNSKRRVHLRIALLVAGLGGCSWFGDGGGGSNEGLIQYHLSRRDTILSMDTAAHTLEVREYWSGCENGVFTRDTSEVTSHFAISGGRLRMWDSGYCIGETYSGTGVTLASGPWNLISIKDSVPQSLRPTPCPDWDPTEAGYRAVSGTVQITGGIIQGASTLSICASDLLRETFETQYNKKFQSLGIAGTLSIQSLDCLREIWHFGSKSAQVSYSQGNEAVKIKFQYGDSTCTGVFPLGDVTLCEEPTMNQFGSCLGKSGFFNAH